MTDDNRKRCDWPNGKDLDTDYHDKEWGVPLHDDGKLFEFILLDSFQAGLSWSLILRKRDAFRRAFHGFDVGRIATYDDDDVKRLMNDSGIVRNRLKIIAAINNARCFLEVQREFGSFDKYIWQFTGGKTIQNRWHEQRQVPASSPQSDAMSKGLKSRGFKFVGTTICYAFMQAAGMVNDHLVRCFRHAKLGGQR